MNFELISIAACHHLISSLRDIYTIEYCLGRKIIMRRKITKRGLPVSEEIILVGNVHQLMLMMGLGLKFKYFRANWKVCANASNSSPDTAFIDTPTKVS